MLDHLHPAFVHFPIVCIVLAFGFQLLQVLAPNLSPKNAGLWLMGVATLFAVISRQTGEIAEASLLNLTAFQIGEIETHEYFANITTWSTILLFVAWLFAYLQKIINRKLNYLILAFLGLLSATVLVTAFLGGELVYIYHIH